MQPKIILKAAGAVRPVAIENNNHKISDTYRSTLKIGDESINSFIKNDCSIHKRSMTVFHRNNVAQVMRKSF
jgi:hypothetical protein